MTETFIKARFSNLKSTELYCYSCQQEKPNNMKVWETYKVILWLEILLNFNMEKEFRLQEFGICI